VNDITAIAIDISKISETASARRSAAEGIEISGSSLVGKAAVGFRQKPKRRQLIMKESQKND
jgi:hypothetical protein